MKAKKTTNGENPISEINAWAMQDGIVLGLVGIFSLFWWLVTVDGGDTDLYFLLSLISGPATCIWLTFRYKSSTIPLCGEFSFTKGFMHALFTGLYASVWVSLAIFVYLRYLDPYSLFVDLANQMYSPRNDALFRDNPDLRIMLDTLSGGRGREGLAEALRNVGPSTYAVLPIYGALFVSPIVAIFSGLFNQHRAR